MVASLDRSASLATAPLESMELMRPVDSYDGLVP